MAAKRSFQRMIRQNVKRSGEKIMPPWERSRTQNRIPLWLTAPCRNAFRQGGWRCPESVQQIRGLSHQRKTFDRCCGCVDSLGVAVFSSYLFKTVTPGEIGFGAGAEGATAPETLRQTDRVT